MSRQRFLMVGAAAIVLGVSIFTYFPPAEAQAPVSPTPIRVQIFTSTPPPLIDELPTATFTPTATLEPAAYLEVIPEAVDGINIRADADPDADILGVAEPGEVYVVTGRFYNWYRFRYERSPNGQAWIYTDYVNLSGDTSLIPDLSVEPQATVDETVVGLTLTQEIITQTPGADMTLTAEGAILAQPVAGAGGDGTGGGAGGLPTFTPPPQVANLQTPQPELMQTEPVLPDVITTVAEHGLPPITPIAVLAGLGIVGLLISVLRR